MMGIFFLNLSMYSFNKHLLSLTMFKSKREEVKRIQRAGEKEPVEGHQAPAWNRDARVKCTFHRGEEWRHYVAGRGELWRSFNPREGRAGWHGHHRGRVRESGSVRSMAVVQEGMERTRGRGGGEERTSISYSRGRVGGM